MSNLTTYEEVLAILESRYEEVNGYDFYREIFPDGERSTECHTDYSHPNAVFLFYDEQLGYTVHRPMFRDTWERDYMEHVEKKENCVCSAMITKYF